MASITRRAKIGILFVVAAVVALREAGYISLFLARSTVDSNFTSGVSSDGVWDVDVIEIPIAVSPLDYIPLSKVRTFEGQIDHGTEDVGINLTYRLEIRTIGLCSGRSFRELARSVVREKLSKSIEKAKRSSSASSP
jgi:hypothetical protein